MKIIFLDVDGVLNSLFTKQSCNSVPWARFVEDKHLELLCGLVQKTGAKLVLSSDWRYRWKDFVSSQSAEGPLGELKDKLREYGLELYSYTPVINNGEDRGREIRQWLRENDDIRDPVENYVIIDDRNDFLREQEPHFVQTADYDGLTARDAHKAFELLNTPQDAGKPLYTRL